MGNKEIYLLQQGDTDLYKIGISKNTKKRIKQLQTGCSQPIKLVNVYESIFYSRIESKPNHVGFWLILALGMSLGVALTRFIQRFKETDNE